MIAPPGNHRRTVSANAGTVHHIIVDQGRQMNHFHHHANGDVFIPKATDRPRSQGDERRAELFSLPVKGVAGMLRDLGLKLVHLRGEAG